MRVRRREPGDVRQRVLRTARFAGEGGGIGDITEGKGEKEVLKSESLSHTRVRDLAGSH